MKFKIVFAIVGAVLLAVNEGIAQIPSYPSEALMVSRIRSGGSARIQGMGGVQTALGGDISSASYNPAGLGMYNRSDFSFTPGYIMNNSNSSYLGNSGSETKSNLIIPNFGIAFHTNKEGIGGFLGGTFAISYNRTNDFNNTFSYSGKNLDNSIIDHFLEDANSTGAGPYANFNIPGYLYNTLTDLAYNNFLIGPNTVLGPGQDSTQYFTDVYPYLPTQTEVVKNSGSQSQWNFSYGANLSDKLFLGIGIGFASFKYKSETTYSETFKDPFPGADPALSPMSEMVLRESLSLSGSGINATFGAIYRPMDQFQFGISIATPTKYQITDSYQATMNTTWNNFTYEPGTVLNNESFGTDNLTSNYNISTPWRFSGGATFFIQKKGLISADVEFLNYAGNKFSPNTSGDNYDADNDNIKTLYKSTVNFRIGGEYRLNKYRFRAGYNLMGDPYQQQQNGISNSISSYSAGVGYRTTNFYIDFATILSQYDQSYRPYTLQSAAGPLVALKNQATTFALTVGFPF